MSPSEFYHFSILIRKVWNRFLPKTKLEKDIEDYETKLCGIVDEVIDATIFRIKNRMLISERSLRDYTNAVIFKTPEKINPGSRTKEIFSRCVLNLPKLTLPESNEWHSKKQYKQGKYWKLFKSNRSNGVKKKEKRKTKNKKLIELQNKKDEGSNRSIEEISSLKNEIMYLINSKQTYKALNLLGELDKESSHQNKVSELKENFEECGSDSNKFSAKQKEQIDTEIIDSILDILDNF